MDHLLHIHYQRFDDVSKLATDEVKLLQSAHDAARSAYAPYSQFQVGCAIALKHGEIITGNNQENRAYPSGLCAERTALFHIGSKQQGEQITKIAIGAHSLRPEVHIDQPATPCGACRQVMAEYEEIAGREVIVLMQGESGPILRIEGIRKNLLPFCFAVDF